jgi:hypothetical protein
MLSDIEIRRKGLRILVENLGKLDAEKFISLIIQEPFDYTEWQETLWSDLTVEQISDKAMKYRKKSEE